MDRLGSPLVAAWWSLVLFYLFAWLRGFRLAEIGVVAALVIGSAIRADTVDLRSLHLPAVEPLVVACVWLLVQAVMRPRSSARWLAACSGAIGTLTVAFWDTPFAGHGGVVPLHLSLGTVLMLGLFGHDAFARFLRQLGSVGLMAASVAAVVVSRRLHEPAPPFVIAYLASVSLVAWAYWFTLRGGFERFAAIVVTACWLSQIGGWVLVVLRRICESRAGAMLLGGVASFVVGVGISLVKIRGRQRAIEEISESGSPP
jgi:hypothetical protein